MSRNTHHLSHNEIRFKRSLFRFTVSFCLALICGLFTNYSIERLDLNQKIANSLQTPSSYQVQLVKPQLRLSQGWLPTLGISLDRVLVMDDSCVLHKIQVQNAFVHFDVLKLLSGQFIPSSLEIDFLDVDLSQSCKNKVSESHSVPTLAKSPPKKTEQKSNHDVQQKIIRTGDWQKAFQVVKKIIAEKKLKKISVDKIHLKYIQSVNKQSLLIGDINADLNSKLDIIMGITQLNLQGQDLPLSQAQLQLLLTGDLLQAQLKSSIREGSLLAEFQIKNNTSFDFSTSIDFNKVPISSFSRELYPKAHLNYLWANCQAGLNGPWKAFFKTPIVANNCLVDGPYGKIQVNNLKATLGKLDELQVDFKKLNLDKILKDRRNIYFSGIFSRYGILNQRLTYKNKKMTLVGSLVDAAFLFSNNNYREVQMVKKFPFRFEWEDKNQTWKGIFNKVDLVNGTFDGSFQFIVSGHKKKTQGNLAIHKIQLNPKIYRLMLNSEATPFQIYGRFEMEDNELKDWSAIIGTPQLITEDYRLEKLKVKARFGKESSAKIRLSAAGGKIHQDSRAQEWIQATRLDYKSTDKSWLFKEVSLRLRIFNDKSLDWEIGRAHV